QDQKRDSGTPYLEEHIWSMGVKIIEKYLGNSHFKELLICGLLHDSVEDSKDVSIEQVKAQFGEEIAAAIRFLTKDDRENSESLTEIEKYEINKNYVIRLSENRLASIIKIEDRLSNLSCIVPTTVGNNLPKYKRYVRETIDVFMPLAQKYVELGYVEKLTQEINRIKLLIKINE
ncbi:MAG: HD domain-containing protein, partial [Patescibacteria group bacterium]